MGSPIPLGSARKGVRGVVASVGDLSRLQIGLATDFTDELERRLLEIGFVEGALVEVLHEGFIGGDPIAIRVDDMSVALRRSAANVVMVRPFI